MTMRPPRVLYLAPPLLKPGQITRYTFVSEEILGLTESGITSYVLSTAISKPYLQDGVRMVPVPPGKKVAEVLRTLSFLLRHWNTLPQGLLANFRKLYHKVRIERVAADLVRREGIDLIHSNFCYPGGLGGTLASRESGVPLVTTVRGADILLDPTMPNYGYRVDPFKDKTVRVLMKNAGHVIAWSDYMLEAAVELGAPPVQTSVVRKGVNLEAFTTRHDRTEVRAALGLKRNLVILTVAGLVERKGIRYIIEALGPLKEDYDFTFVICGDGPLEQPLREMAAAQGIADRTRFEGRVARGEVPKYFAACDIFVLATLNDAAPNVLVEALASARPVITTISGGPQEYIDDGETGFVVPTRDADALRDRLKVLMDDAAMRERFGENGRKAAFERYSYPRFIGDIRAVYQKMLNGKMNK